MARRQVTQTGKGRDGTITSLCNPSTDWSPRASASAIADIDAGTHSYFVSWPNGPTTDIHVVNAASGKYLRTDRDDAERNNLLDLPDC